MTDPDFADRTYIEPLTPEVVARIIEREQPDAVLPTLGGQTGLNTRDGPVPAGSDRGARHAGDDRRQCRGDRHGRGPRAVQAGDGRDRPRRPCVRHRPHARRGDARDGGDRAADDRPAGLHPRWSRHRHRRTRPSEFGHIARVGLGGQPDQRDPDRGVDRRLEGVRARGDARRSRQLRDHLLDRERRSRWACTPATRSPSLRRRR